MFCLTKPGSITKTIPSMVNEVSAMLVARTTFRAFGGVGSKIFCCSSLGRFAYTGAIISSGIRFPSFLAISDIESEQASISSWPVKNIKMSPF